MLVGHAGPVIFYMVFAPFVCLHFCFSFLRRPFLLSSQLLLRLSVHQSGSFMERLSLLLGGNPIGLEISSAVGRGRPVEELDSRAASAQHHNVSQYD